MNPFTQIKSIFRTVLVSVALVALFASLANGFGGRWNGNAEVVSTKSDQTLPANLVDVGIEEHLGQQIPFNAEFLDESGKSVTLGEYFKAGKPVLLNFAYYDCPMLCNLVLNGMLQGMKKLSWTPGKEFEVVTISIDSREGPEKAMAKKQTHIEALGRPEAGLGWHFLTGKDAEIRKVADAVGFKFQYVKATNEFAHAAGIYTVSPAGKISRYLYGVEFKSKDMRLALLDASEGKALSIGEKIEMFCYRYDANAKGYVLFARNFMKGGGYLVMACLFLLLGSLWRKEFRRNKALRLASAGSGL